MAYEESLRSITLEADATLGVYTGVPGTRDNIAGYTPNYVGFQYRFVKVTGDHTVGLADADDTNIVGVLQNKPQGPGHAATVGFHGVSKVQADGPVASGAAVYSSADGQATATAGTAPRCGVALQSAAAAGELIAVLLDR